MRITTAAVRITSFALLAAGLFALVPPHTASGAITATTTSATKVKKAASGGGDCVAAAIANATDVNGNINWTQASTGIAACGGDGAAQAIGSALSSVFSWF